MIIHISQPQVMPDVVLIKGRHRDARERYAVKLTSPHVIVGAKRVYFEFDERFGPTVVDVFGEIKDVQPRENSAFWPAFDVWLTAWLSTRAALERAKEQTP